MFINTKTLIGITGFLWMLPAGVGCLPNVNKIKSELLDTMNTRFDSCEAKLDALAEQLAWCQIAIDSPVPGEPGLPGMDGAPGAAGLDGTNGIDGVAGANGVDGIDGTNGLDGEPCVVYCVDKHMTAIECPDGSVVFIQGKCKEKTF